MFTLTSTAARKILETARETGAQELALRVAARREADGSIDYGMGFDDVGSSDTRLLLEDVPVVIAAHHVDLLEDTMLDFVEIEPGQFNFIFVPQPATPASASSAGCASQGGGCGSTGGGCGSGGGSGGCGTGRTH